MPYKGKAADDPRGEVGRGVPPSWEEDDFSRVEHVERVDGVGGCAEEMPMRFGGKIRRKPNPKGAQASARGVPPIRRRV